MVMCCSHLTDKKISENAFQELSNVHPKIIMENNATFSESKMFACFEKHQKSFSGAFEAHWNIFGIFEKCTHEATHKKLSKQ